MIEPAHQCLSISAQCRLLLISRSSYYYVPVPETEETLALMRVIDAVFLDMPCDVTPNFHPVGTRGRVLLLRDCAGGARGCGA